MLYVFYYLHNKQEIKEKLDALVPDGAFADDPHQFLFYSQKYFTTPQYVLALHYFVGGAITARAPTIFSPPLNSLLCKWTHEFHFAPHVLVPLPVTHMPNFYHQIILQTRFSWTPCSREVQFLVRKTLGASYEGSRAALGYGAQTLYVHIHTCGIVLYCERLCAHNDMLLLKFTSYATRQHFEASFVCFVCGAKNLRAIKRVDQTLCRLAGLRKIRR